MRCSRHGVYFRARRPQAFPPRAGSAFIDHVAVPLMSSHCRRVFVDFEPVDLGACTPEEQYSVPYLLHAAGCGCEDVSRHNQARPPCLPS